MNKNYLIAGVVIFLAVLFGAYVSYSTYTGSRPLPAGVLSSFVDCIKSKSIVFYGAFWCPHCQRTKAMFGDSAKDLPYVECSTPDGQSQTQVCIDKKIAEYPTWMLADGTTFSGEHTLQELSDKFQCPLPLAAGGSATSTEPSGASAATSSQI